MEHNVSMFLVICTIFSCIAPLLCAVKAMKERQSKALIYFVLVMVSAFVTSVGALLVLMTREESALFTAVRVEYIGRIMCMTLMPLFIAEYGQFRMPLFVHRGLVIIGFGYWIFMLDGVMSDFFFQNPRAEIKYQVSVFTYEFGIIYRIMLVEMLFVFAGMFFVLIKRMLRAVKGNRIPYAIFMSGILVTGIAVVCTETGLTDGIDMIPFGMACACIIFGISLDKYHMFDMTQTAKEAVVDHIDEGIVVLDSLKKVIYQNQKFSEMYNEVTEGDSLPVEIHQLKVKDEVELKDHFYQSSITEIKRENGNTQGYLYEFHDTTEMKEKMQKIETLTKEAKAANSAKGQFLANMSHEIRTPINAILGMNEMILRENQDEIIMDYASNIDMAGRTLLTLINDILDYSKIESNHIQWANVVYRLTDLLQEIELKIFPRLEKKDVSFEIHLDDNLPAELFGDEIRVKQILMNLLTNAVKYTEKGKIVLTVSASENKTDPGHFPGATKEMDVIYLIFKVEDTGQGIKEEYLGQIFESFKRLEEGKNRNIEGAGLGLTLTKKILDNMLGTIEATSEFGVGSVFTVTLPQAVYDATPIKAMQLTIHSKEKPEEQKKFVIPEAVLLIVDDNAVNLKVMNGLLKRTKAKLINARSGEECLEIVKKEEVHMIFMDHQMPGMDGLETFRIWKNMEERISHNCPVIALTANNAPGIREQYMAHGFTDYLAKPIDAKELERTLLKYLPMELIVITEQ